MVSRSTCPPALLTALASALALALGCATAPPPTPAYTPTFQFQYPAGGEAPATDVTVAIVHPVEAASVAPTPEQRAQIAAGKLRRNGEAHRAAFVGAMVSQFQELLSRKGLKQRGPFDDLNSMTFPEKKGSDLALIAEIGIGVRVPQPELVAGSNSLQAAMGDMLLVSKTTGPCTASGFVSFVLVEPMSGEKIWVKKVDVPTTEVDCSGTHQESDTQFLDNGVGQVLEKVFPVVMGQAWKYLSPEELTLFKKQAQELRQKKVY